MYVILCVNRIDMSVTVRTEILLCDDDANFAAVLADYLRGRGYNVIVCGDGDEGFRAFRSKAVDICLVDAKMPKTDGVTLLENIRTAGSTVPVIMMGEHLPQEEIIRAFGLGCDDYVDKPLSVEVLICRIEAILRRCSATLNEKAKVFDLGGKEFNGELHTIGGVHMSGRESDLLLLLCRNMGEVVDRQLILRSLWKDDSFFASRSLSVYVNHLRHYLEGTDVKILGVNKRGYKIVNATLH